MAYSAVEWNTGDVITAAKLNNMDNGIVANENGISELSTHLDETIRGSMGRKSFSFDYTIPANGAISISGGDLGITGSVPGFVPVAIYFFDTGNSDVLVREIAAHATATGAAVRLKNVSNSSVTATFNLGLFFIKNQYNINL